MANFKVVISDPKTRKAYQKEIDQAQAGLLGKKIHDKLSADSLGLHGYEIEITGGSDKDGFPMRADVEGPRRIRALLANTPGFHPLMKGQRKRKSVRGNTISAETAQINAKVTKHGAKPLDEIFGKVVEKKEEEKTEKPKAEHKEEKKAEKPKEHKPEKKE